MVKGFCLPIFSSVWMADKLFNIEIILIILTFLRYAKVFGYHWKEFGLGLGGCVPFTSTSF